jgi:hypothetical protein
MVTWEKEYLIKEVSLYSIRVEICRLVSRRRTSHLQSWFVTVNLWVFALIHCDASLRITVERMHLMYPYLR